MKEAFNRLLIAFALAVVQMAACGPVHTEPRSPFTYLGTFIFLSAVWSVILQTPIVVRDIVRKLRDRADRQRAIANTPTPDPKHVFPDGEMGRHIQAPNCWCFPIQTHGFIAHRTATELLHASVPETQPLDRK